MDKRDWVKEQFDKLSDAEYVRYWNKYCEENGYTDGIVLPMDMFNDIFKERTPLEIADAVRGADFNANDDWFVAKETYGWEVTSDCDARYLTEEDDFIDYVMDNISNPEYVRFFDDAEYRDAMLEDMDEDKRKQFESWFDETYTCYMFELDLDDLFEEWRES